MLFKHIVRPGSIRLHLYFSKNGIPIYSQLVSFCISSTNAYITICGILGTGEYKIPIGI